MFYLVHYNRHSGKLVRLNPFEEQVSASKEKLGIEISLLGKENGDEVVILEAKDESDLRRSHSRYFTKLSDFKIPAR